MRHMMQAGNLAESVLSHVPLRIAGQHERREPVPCQAGSVNREVPHAHALAYRVITRMKAAAGRPEGLEK